MENNTSYSVLLPERVSSWYIVLTSLAMIILAILTVAGNIFVIHAVFTNRALRIVPNFFIVSLAVADLLVAILVMPFHISTNITGAWIYGGVLCQIWLTSDVFLCTASILNLCIIALDRYWAIHDPIRYAQKRTVKRVLVMIAISWTLSGMISIPPVFGWGDKDDDSLYDDDVKTCTLSSDKGYVLYSACGSFYIPLAVMSFVYIHIFIATKRRLRERTKAAKKTKLAMRNIVNNKDGNANKKRNNSDSTNDDHDERNEDIVEEPSNHCNTTSSESANNVCNGSANVALTTTDKKKRKKTRGKRQIDSAKMEFEDNARHLRPRVSINNFFEEKQRISLSKERKAARTLAIIMVTFVLCWIPFFLMYLILPFCDSCTYPGTKVEALFVWLGYVNSTLNPIIYTVFNMEFRKAFQRITAKCRGNDSGRIALTRTCV
ncbi:OAR2-like protein [Mya arenaria]|uniref:OAR2-like protein n=1 Tax=Mya arenaria TaxID=6604 RepID=A0ABY7DWY5_MYAAR|nr:OAR2-like protein [Mya arenaria]